MQGALPPTPRKLSVESLIKDFYRMLRILDSI